MGSSRPFPPAPLGTHRRRQCSHQSHRSYHFPSGLRHGFFPESCFGQLPRNSTHCCRHCKARGAGRLDKGEALKVRIGLLYLGLLGISSKEGRTVPQRKSRHDKQLATTRTPQLLQKATECALCILPGFSQVIKIQIALLQTVCAFSFLGVKQTLIKPGAWKEL